MLSKRGHFEVVLTWPANINHYHSVFFPSYFGGPWVASLELITTTVFIS